MGSFNVRCHQDCHLPDESFGTLNARRKAARLPSFSSSMYEYAFFMRGLCPNVADCAMPLQESG